MTNNLRQYNCKHTSYGWRNRKKVSSKLLDKIRWLFFFSLREIVVVTIMHPFFSLSLEIHNNCLRKRKRCNFPAYYSTITMNNFWAMTTAEIHFMSLVTCVATIFLSKMVYCCLVLYMESFSSMDEWIVTKCKHFTLFFSSLLEILSCWDVFILILWSLIKLLRLRITVINDKYLLKSRNPAFSHFRSCLIKVIPPCKLKRSRIGCLICRI